jgi:type II secretory pathway predicted ATPase ExeA
VAALEHRIRLAGGKLDIMTEDALKALYVASRGVPREIMKIANASLLLAAVNDTRPITDDIIKLAVENILSTERNGEPETAELRAGASQ